MTTPSEAELLALTGNIWEVHTWKDSERTTPGPKILIRATGRKGAENRARKISGLRTVRATPWNPESDVHFGKWFSRQPEAVSDSQTRSNLSHDESTGREQK